MGSDRRLSHRFDSVLVANRGEIAVRVIRSARAMGLRTVAVYSDADAGAPHVAMAHDAVRIGPAAAAESYLRMDAILEAAAHSGAQAIHPGYGFLAENSTFARAVLEMSLTWVGPPPSAIEAMGDKASAKRLMAQAGVPLLPGYQEAEQSDERLQTEAEALGVPLMVKAAAGGGGKGMRLVTDAAALAEAIAGARREAKAAFGSDDLILERALLSPRHVEIQVLADNHGTCLSLGERDCSIQRRHQKVVEEAPSPAVDEDLRRAMGQAAVDAARAVGYEGAGTVEFLLEDGEFFFLEMNTRLQVEHPVTEMVTGLDLVEQQLLVAAGESLAFTQDDVRIEGHAIEVRLYAEEPANGFLPSTGLLHAFEVPGGVRVDSGVQGGTFVSADYDPLLAKVIAHGRDRTEARRRLASALEDTVAFGPRTNRTFLVDVLRHDVFAAGDATTRFLQDAVLPDRAAIGPVTVAAAATVLYHRRLSEAARRAPGLAGWSSSGTLASRQLLRMCKNEHEVLVTQTAERLTITVGADTYATVADDSSVTVDGVRTSYTVIHLPDGEMRLRLGALDLEVRDLLDAPNDVGAAGGEGVLVAPMHGLVTALHVRAGDRVKRGQPVVVLEAMKMEHVIAADMEGVIEIAVDIGAQVATNAVLARITPREDGG